MFPQQDDWPNVTLRSQANPTRLSNCIPTPRRNASPGTPQGETGGLTAKAAVRFTLAGPLCGAKPPATDTGP